jgi:hypothetical protein
VALKAGNDKFDPALDEEVPEAVAVKPTVSLEERLTQAIELMAAKQDAGPIVQVPLPKAKLHTPWYNGSRQGRPKLSRMTFMNGNMLREILHSNEEITLLNQIKAGRYCGGRVIVQEKLADQGMDEVEIRLSNKTREDQIANAQLAPNLVALLTRILEESNARA